MKKNINIPNTQTNRKDQKIFWDFLKNFDIFGITFEFRIDKQERFTSTIGGFSLISFVILSICLYIKTIYNFITTPEYNTYLYEKSLEKEEWLNLEMERFNFGIYIDYDKKIFPKNPFIINGLYTELNSNTNYTEQNTEFKIKECDLNKFTSHYDKTSSQKKEILNSMICFDQKNFTIGGSDFSNRLSYFNVEMFINPSFN